MSDEWVLDGNVISTHERLDAIRRIIDDESDVIVEHRFYRGSSAPFRFVCSDFSSLANYIGERTKPGDSLWIWKFEDCCRDDNVAEQGKIPDHEGRVPVGGAY